MSGTELVVQSAFWSAFFIDILIIIYAVNMSKKLGGKGNLNMVIILAGISALIFGIHHILEIFMEHSSIGILIAESIEGVAAIIFGFAAYNLYKLTKKTEVE